MSKTALIIGGTGAIGRALVDRLRAEAWIVLPTGRKDLDLTAPDTWDGCFRDAPECFDAVFFCAGELAPRRWHDKSAEDYLRSYWIHTLGPMLLLAKHKSRFPWWTRIVFVSTTGVTNRGIVDAGYSAAKAAMERMAETIRAAEAWRVIVVRLDLVDSGMLHLLPVETLHGRTVLAPADAAAIIYAKAMSNKAEDWGP